jgi:hypothetical protein
MDVRRRTVIGAAAILLMPVAAGCSRGDGAGGRRWGRPRRGVGEPRRLTHRVCDLARDDPRARRTGPAFSVTNDGTAQHTFAIDTGGELIETPELQPGETQSLEVPALEAGDYYTTAVTVESSKRPDEP